MIRILKKKSRNYTILYSRIINFRNTQMFHKPYNLSIKLIQSNCINQINTGWCPLNGVICPQFFFFFINFFVPLK